MRKIINVNNIDKYKLYYTNSFSIIASEINNIKDSERVHTQTTLKKTFLNRSTSNLSSLVNQLELYKRFKLTCEKNNPNSSLHIQRILWYPYICRFFFTFLNSSTILYDPASFTDIELNSTSQLNATGGILQAKWTPKNPQVQQCFL